jgi:hypothetical protein
MDADSFMLFDMPAVRATEEARSGYGSQRRRSRPFAIADDEPKFETDAIPGIPSTI